MPRAARVWPGHSLLLVEERVAESAVLEALAAAGFDSVLSESTQPVAVADYAGLSSLASLDLAGVRERVPPGDPRRDRYVEGLGAWFHAAKGSVAYRIYYLGDGSSIRPRIEAALSPYSDAWILPESEAAPTTRLALVLFACFAAGLILLVLAKPRGRAQRLVLAAPFALLALRGPEASVAALIASALAAVLAEGLERTRGDLRSFLAAGFAAGARPRELLRRAAGLALRDLAQPLLDARYLLLAALGLLALDPRLLPAIVLSGLASVAGLGSLALAREVRRERLGLAAREAFVPVAILRGRRLLRAPLSGRLHLAAHALAVLALALGAAIALHSGAAAARPAAADLSALTLPQPRLVGGEAGPSPERAGELVASRDAAGLVDLADWLAHRASQEALFLAPFGSSGGDPFAAQGVPLPGGGAAAELRFTAAWARQAYRELPAFGVESLLRSRGTFVRGEVRPFAPETSRPLAPREGLLYIILLAPPLYGAFAGLPRARKSAAGSVSRHYETP
ncbi:MAG: hypothetical protein JNG85_11045 [Spirochaetaceae bacterium]|nr:hypothetical protein [Spirochaetaceae bacterium]